jgi:hypothetical protein
MIQKNLPDAPVPRVFALPKLFQSLTKKIKIAKRNDLTFSTRQLVAELTFGAGGTLANPFLRVP